MFTLTLRVVFSVLAVFAFSVAWAADYHWTGEAGNFLWSDPGNWETATGDAVEQVETSVGKTYNFGNRYNKDTKNLDKVSWGGALVVTQDVDVVIGTALALNPPTQNGESIVIVSAPGKTMMFSETESPKSFADFYTQDKSRLTLKVNLLTKSGVYYGLNKFGTGTLVLDFLEENSDPIGLAIKNGNVEVAETDEGVRLLGVMYEFLNTELATPTFLNFRSHPDMSMEYMTTRNIDNSDLNCRLYLNGLPLTLGLSNGSTGTNFVTEPVFAAGSTLRFQNERRALLRGMPLGGTLVLDRADAQIVTAGTVVRWLFDDETNPLRDDVGAGERLAAPRGMPDVVTDPERGKVLSFPAGEAKKCIRGTDADLGFAELQPQATNNAYTVAFWFKPDPACDEKAKLFFWGVNENRKAAALRFNGKADPASFMFTPWGDNRYIVTGTNIWDGGWHHFAVTYNGNTLFNVYVDGVQVESFTCKDYSPPNKNFYIGSIWKGWANEGENPYAGLLDDFLITSYELRHEDITALMKDGLKKTIGVGSLESISTGEAALARPDQHVALLSGNALSGGITLQSPHSTFTAGTESYTTNTVFKGKFSGANATFVKEGADYALTLAGTATAITNVVVKEGTLALRRPLTRPGLVCSYSFDDDTYLGFDASPAGFHLEPVKVDDGTLETVEGVSGRALRFGGKAYLYSGIKFRPPSFPAGNASYTVSLWVRPTAEACANKTALFRWGKSDNRQLSYLRFESATEVRFSNYSADLSGTIPNATDGKWHHIVVTHDAAACRKIIYFDGNPVATAENVPELGIVATSAFYLGYGNDLNNSHYYTGDMDELTVCTGVWRAEEVKAEYLGKPAAVSAVSTLLPDPVARWSFDDEDAPGADSAEKGSHLTQIGNVTLESGEHICGKAARFSADSGYFRLETFPDHLPTSGESYSIVVRYRPERVQSNSYYPGIVMWGDPAGWDTGKLVKISTDKQNRNSVRSTVAGEIFYAGAHRTEMGTERSRWIVSAFSFDPSVNGRTNIIRAYADGEQYKAGTDSRDALVGKDFAIGSNWTGEQNFYGLIDEVQIYDTSLSEGQFRMIVERLEASKGKSAAAEVPAGVFTSRPDVRVEQGTVLRVGSVENIGRLSGAGTVEIARMAGLFVASAAGFTGTVTGGGQFGLSNGASVAFGDGAVPAFEVDVPFTLCTGVTVTTTLKTGRVCLARARSFVNAANAETWIVSAPAGRKGRVYVSQDGTELYLAVFSGCTVILK